MTRAAKSHGKHYWCVKTALSESGEAFLWADAARLTDDGGLAFLGVDESGHGVVVASFGAGFFGGHYLADEASGRPLAFDHWPGELVESAR